MRALLVGAGGMGKAWARNLIGSSEVQLVGWVDIREGAAAEAAQELTLDLQYFGPSLGAGIDVCEPDFVVDVTAPEAHCAVATLALSRGLPVLGEKPMATSMEEARRMVAASEASGKLLMVSQSRRYDARIIAFRKLIAERIGTPEILNVDFYIGARFGGFRAEMDSPLLLDMAIHTFDQARYLSGADPVSVYAEEFNPSWSWYKGNACANVLFEMTNGIRFAYRGSWCAEGLPTSWEGDWRAVGKEGTAKWQDSGVPQAEIVTDGPGLIRTGSTYEEPPGEALGGITGSLAEFLDALKTGSAPQGECHDNLKSLAMVFGAIEASRSGTRVPVDNF